MKNNLNILIIEDELLIAEMLKEMLLELNYNVVGIAVTYNEACEQLKLNNTINFAILDINLNDHKTGIDLAAEIRAHHKIPFIFLTSYSDKKTFNDAAAFMPEAYLIKPFSKPDLFTTLELIKLKKQNSLKSIIIKDGHANIKLNTHDILWLKTDNIYVEIKTPEKIYVVRNSLDKLLDEINDLDLMRIHRSYAVNIDHVQAVSGQTVVVNGEKLPVSRKFRELLMERYNK